MSDSGVQTLVTRLRGCLPPILARYPVVLAYLHGSAARGKTTRFSDIDIALVAPPDSDLDPYHQLMLELQIENEMEQACGIPNAEIMFMNEAPIAFQGKVLTEGILLYTADEDFRVEFETMTRKRYFDFLPVIDMFQRVYFEKLLAEE